MREIDCIRNRLELGKDTYATGKISTEKLEELCLVLNDFIFIMKSYKVEAYRAYTTSAIREAKNRVILLDYLEKKTGLKIEVLDNAERVSWITSPSRSGQRVQPDHRKRHRHP